MNNKFNPFGHYEMLIAYDGDDSEDEYPITLGLYDKVDYDGQRFFLTVGKTIDEVILETNRYIAKKRLEILEENKRRN